MLKIATAVDPEHAVRRSVKIRKTPGPFPIQ